MTQKRLNTRYDFYNHYPENIGMYLESRVNPKFPKLVRSDVQIIIQMANKEIFPPIWVKEHPVIEGGYGAFASRSIMEHELITTYSGSVLPTCKIEKYSITPDYVMALFVGLNSLQNWSIVPHQWSSFGPMLNYASENGQGSNVETLTCYTDKQFLVILRAKKAIK